MADDLVLREFNGISDDEMLTDAETMLVLFREDMTDYTNFDASLDAAFETDWADKITIARNTPKDEAVEDQQTQVTALVNSTWDKCKICFQDTKYFIDKAFPNTSPINIGIVNEFGGDDYREMSRDQDAVYGFMIQFHKIAEREKIKLIAAGFTQLKIDEIKDNGKAYHEAQVAQEAFKKMRQRLTKERVIIMNDVWHMIQRVNRASKAVFRTDFTKRQQYLMPGAGDNEPAVGLAITGKIVDTNGQAIPGAKFRLTALNIEDTVNLLSRFGITKGIPIAETPWEASAPGKVTKTGMVTPLADGTVTLDIVLEAV